LREVAARGRTVVMTSHDLARAADLASRFDVLSRGVIVASIERADLAQDALLAFYRQALESAERNPSHARPIAAGPAGAGHGI
jgi:heme exporter protein A